MRDKGKDKGNSLATMEVIGHVSEERVIHEEYLLFKGISHTLHVIM